ncbi:MAG: sigma-70 family RNA polymerase sigma factor [Phycisphaerae bacterium]|nr:sigma-70 family RNA polymerase sigma factor [Phycisphaerae bacterium]
MRKGKPRVDLQTQKFISLLTANQNRLYSYIIMRVPCSSDADDVLQDTTATMWEKFQEFESGTDFIAWGLTIARFKVLNFRKKQLKINQCLTDNVVAKIDAESSQFISQQDYRMDALKDCMATLSKSSLEILQMRYAQQLTVRTISAHIGKAEPSIYKIIAKIHQGLLDCVRGRVSSQRGTSRVR